MTGTIAEVDAALRRYPGELLEVGSFGHLVAKTEQVQGAACTRSDGRALNCDSVVLKRIRWGEELGLLLGNMTGNYKDDGTAFASAIGAYELASAFSRSPGWASTKNFSPT